MANTFRSEGYKPIETLSLILTMLFGVQLVCFGFYVVLGLVQIASPNWTFDFGDEEPAIPIAILLIGLLAIAEIFARLATMVLFLVWEYRAYSNLSVLKARDLEFSPGWAVGWWFIPFANLIKPYQAVTELWRESDPDFDPDLGYLTSSVGNPGFFAIWWATWIIGNIASRITDRMSETPSGDISESFPFLLIASSVILGVSAALAIRIVRDVARRQQLRLARISMEGSHLPPPPPNFGSGSSI